MHSYLLINIKNMDNVKGCLSALVFFGFFTGIASYADDIWQDLSLRDGNNLLWLSIGIFAAFLIWQTYGLIMMYRQPAEKGWKRIAIVSFGGAGLFFLFTLVVNYLAHNGGDSSKAWVAANNFKDIIVPSSNFFSIVWLIIVDLLLSVIVATILLCTLLLGRIGPGASVAVAVHNWANGGGFDIGAVIEAIANIIIDVKIDNVLGFFIGLGWFILTSIFLKKVD